MTTHADPKNSHEAAPGGPSSQPVATGADVVAEFTQRDLLAVIVVALAFALTPWVFGDFVLGRTHAPGTKKSTTSARDRVVRVCGAISPAGPSRSGELPRKRCVL